MPSLLWVALGESQQHARRTAQREIWRVFVLCLLGETDTATPINGAGQGSNNVNSKHNCYKNPSLKTAAPPTLFLTLFQKNPKP